MNFELTDIQREIAADVPRVRPARADPQRPQVGREAPVAHRGREEAGRAGAPGRRGARGVRRRGARQRLLRAGDGGDQPRLRLDRRDHEREQLALLRPGLKFGTEAQKQEFLTPFARGEKLGCFGLTEPEAGSDAAAQKTVAVKPGRRVRHQRHKNWITNGPHADVIVLFAMTEQGGGQQGHHRVPRAHQHARASRAPSPTRSWASRRALLHACSSRTARAGQEPSSARRARASRSR